MVHHPKQRSASDGHPAIINAKIDLCAFISSPHILKLTDVQLPNAAS
jgi:hypothetical protein